MKRINLAILCLSLNVLSLRSATVTTVNNENPGAGQTSLLQALSNLQEGETVRFNIPGPGPHVIVTPLGGYPLISNNNITIDGYSQPGSSPNTNPILGGNNAQIKIVLDSTGADSAPNDPQDPALNRRRSTRILHSGYGDSENGILAVFSGDNFKVQGLSFIARRTAGSTADPSIYAVALVNQATNARIQGCWFGLAPGGSTMADVKPVSSAVAAFRYRTGGDVYSYGCIVGTDGDGVSDRAEFNVMVGGRISIALELPGARISGNYVNVFPDGLHFVDLDAGYQEWIDVYAAGGSDPEDVTIENFENGRVTDSSVIGTNGDGVSDSNERNVFGHVVYDHLGEFYSSSVDVVLAGNYFGVGVDGVTPAPLSTNKVPDFVEFGGSGQIRIGSNGDGISDDAEGNRVVNVPGRRFVISGSLVPIVSRRNKLVNCGFSAISFANGENADYANYYAPYLADVSAGVAPVLQQLTNGILSGRLPAPGAGYPNAIIDLYTVDPAALAKTNFWPAPMTHPLNWLGSYSDNGAGDLNPAANEFSINVSAFGLSTTSHVAVAVSYSQQAGLFNGTNAITSPMSNPVAARPVLSIAVQVGGDVVLSWFAPEGLFTVEPNNNLADPNGWFPLGTGTYFGGRNIVTLGHDPFLDTFFRLVSR